MDRILIVDDRQENRYMLCALLEGHGYEAVEAANGEEALAAARAEPPALVISDLLMPVMDGFTLLRRWRADPALAQVPFVVYTATYTDPKDEQLALSLGADAFLLKPAEPGPFLARIAEVLTAAGERRLTPRDGAAPADEQVVLREYSEALVRKLEKRTRELQETQRSLLAEIEVRKEGEARFRSLVDTLPYGVQENDLEGTITFSNAAHARMHGCEPGSMVGRRIWDMQPSEQERAATRRYLEYLVRVRPEPTVYHARDLKADGTPIDVEIVWTYKHDAAGELCGFISVISDVTARREAEREQRRLQSSLEHAQKMEAVGRLAGGLAHDLNNMLGVIIGYADMALPGLEEGNPLHADIQQIRAAAFRSAELTRHLLAFARKQPIAPVAVDLNAILLRSEGMYRRLAGEEITLSVQCTAEPCTVFVDPTQLDQILANLVLNARDAIAGVGRIGFATRVRHLAAADAARHPGAEPGDYAVIEVSDDGCGMDEGTLDKLFEPFFTTKPEGKGTGLGLSSVYGIVRQNLGFIEVTSRPGEGSCFRVHLPLTDRKAAPQDTDQRARPVRGSETVLVVEDNEQILGLCRRVLEREGYRVIASSSPNEALVLAGEHRADIRLLLTDVVMPTMNGSQLSRRIRELVPGVATLFMSGYPNEIVAGRGVLDSSESFIQKPFTALGLVGKVRDILDSAPPAGGAAKDGPGA